MSLVLDASAAAGWLMPDEGVPDEVAGAVQGAAVLCAPWLFWRNILIVGERRGRLPDGTAEVFLDAVEALGIELETKASSSRVLQLARRHRLSAYDALYLEVALRRELPLATLDTTLGAAAAVEGVRVVERAQPRVSRRDAAGEVRTKAHAAVAKNGKPNQCDGRGAAWARREIRSPGVAARPVGICR